MKLTFTASASQKVSIKMTSVTIGSNPIAGTTVTLMKGSTTVGVPALVGTTGGYIDTSATLTAGATYTIKIDPQGMNTGSMTVNLYTVPADATGTIPSNGSATVVSQHRPRPEHQLHVHRDGQPEGSASTSRASRSARRPAAARS